MFVCFSSLLNSSGKIWVQFDADLIPHKSTNFYVETGSLPDCIDRYFWPAISISDTNRACGNCSNLAASKLLEKYCNNQKNLVQPNVLIVDKVWITPPKSKLLWVPPCEGRMLSRTLMRHKYWDIKMFTAEISSVLDILYSLYLSCFPLATVKQRSNIDKQCYMDGSDTKWEGRYLSGTFRPSPLKDKNVFELRCNFVESLDWSHTFFYRFGFSGSKWKLSCCSTRGDWFPVQFKGILQHQCEAHSPGFSWDTVSFFLVAGPVL